MNTNSIIVFDFETGGKDRRTCDPIELSALVYNSRTLEPIHGATFSKLIRPTDFDKLEQEALDVNKITREELKEKGIDQKLAWNSFVDFVKQYTYKKDSFFTAPIAAGLNIKGFDLHIIHRMCEQYGPFNKDRGEQKLFYPRNQIDLLDLMYLWFGDESEPKNYQLDTLREFFGLSKEGSHRAMRDVEDTGAIIMRFLKLKRRLKNIKFSSGLTLRETFKGAFCANKV